MNYGKKVYEVLSLERTGPKIDWTEATIVKDYSHEDAAATWAEEDDQQGDYSIINRGKHGPVLVREEGSEDFLEFMISAESCPRYSAYRSRT